MAFKFWSLGYAFAQVDNALHHATSQLAGSATASYPAALKTASEALKRKNLTPVVATSGTALLPTLNHRQASSALALS